MKQINKKIEDLEHRKRVTDKTIEMIEDFWDENQNIIGRRLGNYFLNELKYSNAYSGCYGNYICVGDEYEPYILGRGYEGVATGSDYNTYEIECADREQHLKFLREFPKLLKEKLEEVEKQQEEMSENAYKIEKMLKNMSV